MAQYQKNFYASSIYGHIKAFYGEYLTETFDAQEPFSSHINAKIQAKLPSTFYKADSSEFLIGDKTKWTIRNSELVTKTANAPVEFIATGTDVEVQIRLQNIGEQNIKAELFKEEIVDGVYQWVSKQTITASTLSPTTSTNTIRKVSFDSFGFGDYKVVLEATTTSDSAEAIIVGAALRTSDYALQIKTSPDNHTWSEWTDVILSEQVVNDAEYTGTGQSNAYSNIRYVQGKLILLSSDNESSPIIDRVELRSDDSGLYDPDGDYTIKIDMNQVATQAGVSFKYTDKIRWSQKQPAGAQMDIRSSSSLDNVFWGPVTAPYRQNTKRLRLKRGVTNHSLTLGPINEGVKFAFSKTSELTRWNTQAYLPKDPNNTKISYVFSKTRINQKDPRNLLQSIDNPMNVQNKAVQFNPQPYFLTVELARSSLKGTPVVDFIDIYQKIKYNEVVNISNKDASLVDGKGTGIKSLQKISDYPFTYPSASNQIAENASYITSAPQTYSLTDRTSRPNDVMLYFKSEENNGTRTNTSSSSEDEIISKVMQRHPEFGETTGVLMHYQYGAGKVQYLRPYKRDLDSTFTPSLLEDIKYRYYIRNGWPSEIHIAMKGQTVEDVSDMYNTKSEDILAINNDLIINEDGTLMPDQQILIPNNYTNSKVSLLFDSGSPYTQKSSHNAVYDQSKGLVIADFSSEQIAISIPNEPEKGYVDWTSEEKIYNGVININDTREEFIRTQYNRSTNSDFNREYVVNEGDTWESISSQYDVHINDLKMVNDEIDDLTEGLTITIPPNIILPELAPEAEFETENPYKISIIPDSVHKKNGVRIDESFIPINESSKHLPLEITYRDSEILTAEMVRGDNKNGMDPLPLSNVKKIVSIKGKTNEITYHQWDNDLQAGDYKLNSSYVDWSPTGEGTLEPEIGEEYIVTYIRREVDTVKVYLDTDYYEKTGTDLVWRSPEIKVLDGICSPNEDFQIELPPFEDFNGYSPIYKNVGYIVEDNDLWVETNVEEIDGKHYLVGTLNGKNPIQNWHPTINKGYYYLKEQEFYLYSEPTKTVLAEKELPTAKNIEYVNNENGIGALLSPSSENLVKDSGFTNTEFKKAVTFSVDSL